MEYKTVIIFLIGVLIAVVVGSGYRVEKSVREIGHALCQMERLELGVITAELESYHGTAQIICGGLLGKFAK